MNNNVLVVYYSGTGGTKRIADEFEAVFTSKKHKVVKCSLDKRNYDTFKEKNRDLFNEINLIILLYPVYALEAPKLIFEWLEGLPAGKNTSTVVVSVSGGGEIWPNTSCRVNVIKALEKKNYDVVYEKMMVMPANVLIQISDHLVMHLLNCIPEKVNKIVNDILDGRKRRDKIHISTYVFSLLHMEKHTKGFSNYFRIRDNCSACGWCIKNCPIENIELKNRIPKFGNNCVGCLRCVYGCRNKSI
ncbi:MAG: hypothetical protein GX660_00750, partial [Clostridiaceae bacterium]|nr:hypothetical protein [Clostridiaceae bacterium]